MEATKCTIKDLIIKL